MSLSDKIAKQMKGKAPRVKKPWEKRAERSLGDMIAEKRYANEGGRHRASNFARSITTFGVSNTAEFKRIEALPRREWETAEDLDELTTLLTEDLKHPDGDMSLWPAQAASLREIHDMRGLVGSLAVGEGKALISLLAPVVLKAKRPILLVPADVREQTNRKVIPEMRKHWKLHPKLKVIGYSELSLMKNKDFLEEFKPDVIISDEAHSLAGIRSARTRRVTRYMREHEETIFIALSGTITRKGLRDYWHLAQWALKPLFCPMPTRWNELQDWADALDADVPEEKRISPGALKKLCEGKENARQGYMRRFTQTPGVISTKNNELVTSLRIHKRDVKSSGAIHSALNEMQTTWETPYGDVITEAIDLARKLREISMGFFYRWDPEPPIDWLDARKAWKKFVRETLRHNRRNLDTELQVWNEQRNNKKPVKEWLEWCGIKESFKPNTVPVWLDEYMIEDATNWLRNNDGIVWTTHVALAERLAEHARLSYFGAGKQASIDILDVKGPIIASIKAHGQGKNLQHNYCKNLVMCCPPAGKTWEQMLGRTHRKGQLEDEVTCEVYMHTDAVRSAWQTAKSDARYLEDTTGVRQKLNYADITFEV